jgi:hypothetical protein
MSFEQFATRRWLFVTKVGQLENFMRSNDPSPPTNNSSTYVFFIEHLIVSNWVQGYFLREYKRNSQDLSLRIMTNKDAF